MKIFKAIDDIIAAEGERIPNASTSQKTFKTAFILLIFIGLSVVVSLLSKTYKD